MDLLQLRNAALDGNIQLLLGLHAADPLLLARIAAGAPNDTPLHVAVLLGHSDFAGELLRLCPALAGALDLRGSAPLHYAAAKGDLGFVNAILVANPDTCMVLGGEGLNPLHLAGANGRVDVLKQLVAARPTAARQRTADGDTVLHLCGKYGQGECLDLPGVNFADLINERDDDGNTPLHVAVALKQTQVVKRLIQIPGLDINATNAAGHTVTDILTQSCRGPSDRRIQQLLQQAGGPRIVANPTNNNVNGSRTWSWFDCFPTSPSTHGSNSSFNGARPVNQDDWLAKKRDALMIVAILLATMAFQAGVTPPGGVWGSNGTLPDSTRAKYRAGEAVVAYNYPQTYKYYLRANTIGFVASLSTILLLISGLPIRNRYFMWLLMAVMWLSITSMAFTYAFSIVAVTPKKDRHALRRTMYVAVPVWCGVMALLVFGHSIRLAVRWLRGTTAPNIPVVGHANGNTNVTFSTVP